FGPAAPSGSGATQSEAVMKISVVIPHLNQPEQLARCLGSLQVNTRPADEILVVDNGSKVLPTDVCSSFSNVQVLSEQIPGPGPARNQGVAKSTGDILAFIDADCVADPNWLRVAEKEMSDPKTSILGGEVLIACDDPVKFTSIEAYESIYGFRMRRYVEKQGYAATLNMVVSKEVFGQVGEFKGLEVAEDHDWGRRATALGFKIKFVPDMIVCHPARSNFNELKKKWERHIAHDFQVAKTSAFRKARFLGKSLLLLLSPIVEIPKIATTQRITGIGNRFRAFFTLCRIRYYRAKLMLSLVAGWKEEDLFSAWNR
ncbi:MAG: glycosyltransferase, partial [Paracoccaceae bacterium]|nr:glycosyltransferase [Paracoccaceae bacterium]